MSTKIMHACWDLQLPMPKKMLLISLADQANDDGVCTPVPDSTASRCCMHRATLFRALDWLEERGFIKREGAEHRRKTYRLTPQLGRCSGPDDDGPVVAESDYQSRRERLPESQRATTVVAQSDYQSRRERLPAPSFSPLINPPLSLKDKEGASRARAGARGVGDPVVPIPPDFRPPDWVGARLAAAGFAAAYQPHHVQRFIAHHRAKGTRRSTGGWGEEFVGWMILEHTAFAPAKTGPAPAAGLTPAERAAKACEQQLAYLVSELRGSHRFKTAPPWRDAAAVSALQELGDFGALVGLPPDEFETQVVGPFARLYRTRVGHTQRGAR